VPAPAESALVAAALSTALWTALGYLSGTIMFSWLIARWILKVDLTRVGDDNPGAYHLFRIGGLGWGLLGAALDVAKAALPVLAAAHFGVRGWWLVPVMIAPIVGHDYPPWPRLALGGHGLSVSFGVWFALTGIVGPVVLFVSDWFFQYVIVAPTDGWALMLAMLVMPLALYGIGAAAPLWTFWVLDTALLAWRHRDQLAVPLTVRLLRRSEARPS
jgi:glycerol-3-phosphate acyltransferase PlsY